MAYFQFYLPSLYLLGLCFVLMAMRIQLLPSYLGAGSGVVGFYLLLGLLIVVPAAVLSFLKLNLRYVINSIAALLFAILAKHVLGGVPWALQAEGSVAVWVGNRLELIVLALFALGGLVSAEIYRRSHRYIVTNARVFTRAGIFAPDERIVPLAKINDIELDRHFIGRLLGYGTVIPLTGSGIGMGSDLAAVSGTVAKQWKVFGYPTVGITVTGGHSIQVPKTRTHEVLFGVRRPAVVRDIIMKAIAERDLRVLEHLSDT